MGSGRRTLLLSLAWLATAVAAGLLGARLLRPEVERVVVYLDRPAGAGGNAADPAAPGGDPLPARAPSPGAPRAPGAARSAVAPEPPPAPEPAAGPLPPASIQVTVMTPEGKAIWNEGSVYALSPGEEGTDDGENVCRSDLDQGTALLRLPGAGLYDIGFSGTRGTALVQDVRVPPGDGATLTIHLPGELAVHAACLPGWPPSPGAVLVVHLWSDPEPGGLAFPGRGRGGAAGVDFEIGPEGSGDSPPLPSGRSFEVSATVREVLPQFTADSEEERRAPVLQDSCRFTAEPDRGKARPGEAVRFRILAHAALLVSVSWDRTGEQAAGNLDDKAWPDGKVFVLDFVQASAKRREELKGTRWVRVPPARLMIPGEAGPVRLEWSGNGFRAGSREDLVLRAGEILECSLTFQIDPEGRERPPPWAGDLAAEQEAPPALEPLRVTVEGARPGQVAHVFGIVPGKNGNGDSSYDLQVDSGADFVEAEGDLRGAPVVGAVAFPDMAADPATVPATGPMKLQLRPAGLLLVAPDEIWSQEFGRLRLRLPGRRLLPKADESGTGFGDARPEVEVVAGTLVGPLPEGTYTFEVRLGGVRLPDATATVRAGKVEVLRIRR